MQNQWLALDATTSPKTRARQLRRAWDHVLAERAETERTRAEVREPIAESWERSLTAGLDPGGWFASLESDPDETRERWLEHPLSAIAGALTERLAPALADTENLFVVSDASGVLLRVEGAERLRRRASEDMNFVEGAKWAEDAAGTNAVGVALAADHSVQVFASEHFNANVHGWTCSAAPVHDPLTGETVAIVDFSGPYESAHPLTLALAENLAATMEHALADASRERDARLQRRYGDLAQARDLLVTGDGRVLGAGFPGMRIAAFPERGGTIALDDGSRAVVEPLGDGEAFLVRRVDAGSGKQEAADAVSFSAFGRDRLELRLGERTVTLSPRHSEIVALLAEHPEGLTADELAGALYGDFAKPVTARAEISRLRAILGTRLEAEPYRLTGPIESDIASLKRLLRQGRVAEAAELHAGPLLPRSDAPGVVDLRHELERWTRHAVLTSDDTEALWAWVSRPSGAVDLQAWVRFLANVPYEDGRRALAAAHVARLRGR